GAGEAAGLLDGAGLLAGRGQSLSSARLRLVGIAHSRERSRLNADRAERALAALDAAKPAEVALGRIERLRATGSRLQALAQERQKALGQIELHGRTLEEARAKY